MGASGTATLDFGAFPGSTDASVAVTGQTGILSGSLVEAWIFPGATADHSADEHLVESLRVVAGNVSAGVGFTIYGLNANAIHEPLLDMVPSAFRTAAATVYGSGGMRCCGGTGTTLYGKWQIGWVWA